MQFHDLNLIDPLLRAVRAEGYNEPTLIQRKAIPQVLAGRDLIGCAQTGTGKTAAFALPILQQLTARTRDNKRRSIRVLVLSPTRELATQIGDSFASYGRYTTLKHTVVYGGVGQNPQVQAIRRGVDILVATPGRLLDLMGQGHIRLDRLEILVLDEADRMLDMGFIHDVRRIVKAVPDQRQTLLFSATMPQDIQELADQILVDPVKVEVVPQGTTVEKIDQSVFFVKKSDKRALLEHILSDHEAQRVLVFTRTKHGANRLTEQLGKGHIRAEAIHGNKSQRAREQALRNFKSGKVRVLVATDIAARGIDVDDITHVINYDLPNEAESYVHRIGRTARAGASGVAFSFCDAAERKLLADIEKLIRQPVPVMADHPYMSAEAAVPMSTRSNNGGKPRNNNYRRRNRSSGGRNNNRSANGNNQSRGNRSNNHSRKRTMER
jgi:ATP-dependent RNA helicase RhlE